MFSVVIPTRKNYGFHLNQSTVMEQQDKIRDFFILLWHIFLNDANTKKKAKYNLSERISSTESSGWKLCNILSKHCWGGVGGTYKKIPKPVFITVKSFNKGKAADQDAMCDKNWKDLFHNPSCLPQHSLWIKIIIPDATFYFIHRTLQFSISLSLCAFLDDLISNSSWEILTSKMKPD